MSESSTELDTSEFFGGMPPAIAFEKVGDKIAGVVVDKRVRQQVGLDGDNKGKPLTWPNGDPKWESLVILQVYAPSDEDDGQRTLYVRSGMHQAFREGIRAARQSDLHIGDYIQVEHTSVDKPARKGVNGQKRFRADINKTEQPELPEAPTVESSDEPPF
jgi:hypothetical protein